MTHGGGGACESLEDAEEGRADESREGVHVFILQMQGDKKIQVS